MSYWAHPGCGRETRGLRARVRAALKRLIARKERRDRSQSLPWEVQDACALADDLWAPEPEEPRVGTLEEVLRWVSGEPVPDPEVGERKRLRLRLLPHLVAEGAVSVAVWDRPDRPSEGEGLDGAEVCYLLGPEVFEPLAGGRTLEDPAISGLAGVCLSPGGYMLGLRYEPGYTSRLMAAARAQARWRF